MDARAADDVGKTTPRAQNRYNIIIIILGVLGFILFHFFFCLSDFCPPVSRRSRRDTNINGNTLRLSRDETKIKKHGERDRVSGKEKKNIRLYFLPSTRRRPDECQQPSSTGSRILVKQ